MGATDEEQQWIVASRNGDPVAVESLIKMHQRMLHALTFRMTGSMADAEDLAQETFIQAFQCLGEFRGDAAFSSWLYRIAMNKCLNWRKREQRRTEMHDEWGRRDENESRPNDSHSWDVQQALMKLQPKQRAAIVLTIYEGQSHAEAAQVLGCSETTVSWRVFSAKGKLRRWLGTRKADDE
jgi:RNA polymerase sigma-70 factor, ECF subfamily